MRDYEFVEWIGSRGDVFGYFDIDGKPVRKNPRNNPYSYDTFVLFRSGDFTKADTMADSDRMQQWDHGAFSSALQAVWPDTAEDKGFRKRKTVDIEQFLNLYFKRKLRLTALLENCNVSNGSPYWTFAFVYLD